MDLSGRVIHVETKTGSFSYPDDSFEINTSALEAGMYILSIIEKNKIAAKSFLVVR